MSEDVSAGGVLPAAVARIAAVIYAEQKLDDILGVVIEAALASLPSADEGSVTLRDATSGRLTTRQASSDVAMDLDKIQYESAYGPCVTAAGGTSGRWQIDEGDGASPEFTERARILGIQTAFATPLTYDGEPLGALNLFSRHRHGFDAAEERLAHLFATQASIIVGNGLAFRHAQELNTQLTEALATRETIGQAKGILMERHRLDSQAAFLMLRDDSQRSNRKLRDVARAVVAEVEDAADH
jgi:GAF domain-containing protein